MKARPLWGFALPERGAIPVISPDGKDLLREKGRERASAFPKKMAISFDGERGMGYIVWTGTNGPAEDNPVFLSHSTQMRVSILYPG